MGYSARIYRSLGGSYLALLVGPVVAALAAGAGVGIDPWLAFSLGALLAGALGYLAVADLDPVRWFTNTWVAVAVTLLPLGHAVWLIALLAHNPDRALLTIFARPSTAGALAFGVALVAIVLAHRQQTVERIRAATVYASFPSGPAARRRRVRYGTFAVGLGVVAGLLAVLAMHGALSSALLVAAVLIGPLAVLSLYATHDRSVVVTDDGLAIDGTFTEWTYFDSYDLTERSLVLRFRSHWMGDIALDVSDVDALDTVRDALDEHVSEAK
ncbi:hypothetical protein [Halorientalis salina]|uniref:hypothetical protein n=1 Tax=Halorientalis salina TaxID=2932266 RepID=UPI0010AC2A2D|nr:hypothetical protein [Halorientalis salina]